METFPIVTNMLVTFTYVDTTMLALLYAPNMIIFAVIVKLTLTHKILGACILYWFCTYLNKGGIAQIFFFF
jgi:hypothetical protein